MPDTKPPPHAQPLVQVVLVRPGWSTPEGLAAGAARASWLAVQHVDIDELAEWTWWGRRTTVRKAGLRDFSSAVELGWVGDEVAVASPLLQWDRVPDWVRGTKPDGWRCWGTQVPSGEYELVVPRSPDDPTFVRSAVAAVHGAPGYHGQSLVVRKGWPRRAR